MFLCNAIIWMIGRQAASWTRLLDKGELINYSLFEYHMENECYSFFGGRIFLIWDALGERKRLIALGSAFKKEKKIK